MNKPPRNHDLSNADADCFRDLFFGSYYTRAFSLFHADLARLGLPGNNPPKIRARFWQFVVPRAYHLHEARSLLERYLIEIEKELQITVAAASLAYWLHFYRRLWPGPIGENRQPATIMLTRAVLEAAIQKYAKRTPCNRIGVSHEVPLPDILNGLLLNPDFAYERNHVQQFNQLILTHVGPAELLELYEVEKLAYEVWRCGAVLRAIGKGAPFVVDGPPYFYRDDRSDDLDWLFQNYDTRLRNDGVSATGVVYDSDACDSLDGFIFLPNYNVSNLQPSSLAIFLEEKLNRDVSFSSSTRFNFLWTPLHVRAFLEKHKPFSEKFSQHYGVSLDAVLLVVSSLWARLRHRWNEEDAGVLVHAWQRGYEGPYQSARIWRELTFYRNEGASILGIAPESVNDTQFLRALRFWALTPNKKRSIELLYSGRHFIFLPFGRKRWFIDYAWINRRLYSLFNTVQVDDQNFKGDALETAVRRRPSCLPSKPCKGFDNTSKQIDAAYRVGSHLILVECKAVSRSIGYDKGDPNAILYRRREVVDRALREADAKAKWLLKHPKGTNYNISDIKDILPVAVSPFVEFIPSRRFHYWVNDKTPRVLTPDELFMLLDDVVTLDRSLNRFPLI